MTLRHLLVICCLAATTLLIVGVASAHFFDGRYADNDQHRFVSIESNDSHFEELDEHFSPSMYWDFEVDTDNDINTINDGRQSSVPGTNVDVYWYATDQNNFSKPTVLGDATCMVTMSDNKCDQFRVRFNEDRLIGSSTAQKGHTVCHEISHTFGANNGLTEDNGCWPQSKYSLDTDLNSHEIDHLKDRY